MATLEIALGLIAEKHAGQKDRGGAPYVLHPLAVMAKVQSIEEKIVAVLHDVVEDTDVTFNDLSGMGFSVAIVRAVESVTKREGEDRFTAAHRSAANRIGCAVKLADVSENMNMSRLTNPTAKDFDRLEQYKKVKEILEDAKMTRWNNFLAV